MTHFVELAKAFKQSLHKDRVITDESICYALGTDASFYRLTPKIIVKINSIAELVQCIQLCKKYNTRYTFRAAGTSLSGQAISDSVLMMFNHGWKDVQIQHDGEFIKLQCAVIGAEANRLLQPYDRKIGPDPASIKSCMIGGIAANNSSGMCCGTAQNSYQTLSSMTIVLADGTLVDTGNQQSIENFRLSHAKFLDELSQLSSTTKNNQQLSQIITHKYRLKNTTGYSINALIDFDDPIDILQHLMIGSEGTLGFIADITLKTVADYAQKSTALYIFENIETTCEVVTALSDTAVNAVELMDGRSLRAIKNKSGAPQFLQQLDIECCALLIECQSQTKSELLLKTQKISNIIDTFNVLNCISFTLDKKSSEQLWNIRKGLFPVVGAKRVKGTTVVIEDIAFPIKNLAVATRDLQQLLTDHNYPEAIIFGHALAGNLHFVFTQDFGITAEVQQYKNFMLAVTELVTLKYQGSLKAEHGTGRNMAPFVELEWGKQAYQLMQQIKQLFDPAGLINPDVIINSNPDAHFENLKALPVADDLIDECTECGFCEVVCPSRSVTLTPRQRIVMYRQLQQLISENKMHRAKKLSSQFDALGIDSCAATGLCEASCPVGINTGDLIRKLRHHQHPSSSRFVKWSSEHFSIATGLLKFTFNLNAMLQKIIPDKIINTLGNTSHRLSGKRIPIWFSEYPGYRHYKLKSSENSAQNKKTIVYMPACSTRIMGTQNKAKDQRSLDEVVFSILEKSGYKVIIPANIKNNCCGLPYDSKGYFDESNKKLLQLEDSLWNATNAATIPVLIDSSSCAKQAMDKFSRQIEIYEPVTFITKYLLNRLQITAVDETIMLHISCSDRLLKNSNEIIKIAKACSNKVIIPAGIQCCGWAGDKGFNTPELNQSALATLKQQVPENCSRGFSTNLNCEIGLSHHSGIPYQSILYLLDEVSTAATAEKQQ